jgi:hypothetical protein
LDNTLRHLLPHEKCADLKDHPDVLFSIMVIRIPRKYLINVDTLLFEIDFLSDETNSEIFLIIQRYIKDTGRFSV